MLDEMLQHIPWEMKKSEILIKYFKILEKVFNSYLEEIKKSSNYVILNDLNGKRLELYGDRYGVIKKPRWRDRTLRRAIAISRKRYENENTIIDNFYNLITKTTNYKAQIEYMKYKGESGAINVSVQIPPAEPTDLLGDLEKLYVYGCRVDYDVSMPLDIENKIDVFTTRYIHENMVSNNDWR